MVARVINQLRSEHLSRGVAVREALAAEHKLIENNQREQNQKLLHIEQVKAHARQKVEELGTVRKLKPVEPGF